MNNSNMLNAQKVKFSIKDFFSKCDQTRLFKFLMGNFIFWAVSSCLENTILI